MRKQRTFHITTEISPEGIEYSYSEPDELLCGITIRQRLDRTGVDWVVKNIQPTLFDFLEWAKQQPKGMVLVELLQKITFDAFWLKYDDRIRSSKKRSQKLWEKLSEADQAKAYYFIDTYNRSRGNAEKKYCETYLNAELWNN